MVFTGNTARFGGGLCAISNSVMDLSDGVLVRSNVATEHGGGVLMSADCSLVARGAVTVADNEATHGAGIFANKAVVDLDGTEVRGNRASQTGGGVLLTKSALTLQNNASIVSNEASRLGGGLHLSETSTLECYDASVVNNVADVGGGVHALESRVHLKRCELSHNTAKTQLCGASDAVCGGGGLAASERAVVTMEESRVVGNRAGPAGSGGAILFPHFSGSALTLRQTLMQDNHAGARGGALFAGVNTNLTLTGRNIIERNEAGRGGGALFSSSHMFLSAGGQTVLRGNRAASGQGGALVAVDATVYVARGHSMEASGNSAGQDGGAVALLAGGQIVVADKVALNFTGNLAGGDGGAVFRDSEACLRLDESCFLDGYGGDGQALLFVGNRAGKAGGAVHVACEDQGSSCTGVFERSFASTASTSSVQLRDNSATLYGDDVSTVPSRLGWNGGDSALQQSVAPGLQTLSLAVARYDDMGSLIPGTGETASFVVCGADLLSCQKGSGVLPGTVEAFDQETGVSNADVDVECLVGSDEAVVRVGVVGASSPGLSRSMTVVCSCGVGQARSELAGRGTWVCAQCEDGNYVVDPNNPKHSCEKCPEGAVCNGGEVSGKIEGSVWEADSQTGRFQLTSCPAGYAILVPASHDAQTCVLCEPGWYCAGGGVSAVRCPAGRHSVAGATQASACTPAVFVGFTISLPLSKEEFELPGKQDQFKAGVAAAAETDASMVLIDSVSQTSTGRRVPGGGVAAGRSLLAGSVDVQTRIVSDDDAGATGILGRLTIENINNNLALQGVPGGEMSSAPTLEASEPGADAGLVVGVVLGAMAVIFFTLSVALMRWRSTSHRLAGAVKGTHANQRDLPPSLRNKYRAQQVLGSGGSGVVLEAHQITRGKTMGDKQGSVSAWRAVKLVHGKGRKMEDQEVRRLEREVRRRNTLTCFETCCAGPPCLGPERACALRGGVVCTSVVAGTALQTGEGFDD